MKKCAKKLTSGCLGGLFFVAMTMPVLSQDYTNDYSYEPSYRQPVQSTQLQQPQTYQQAPAYQQPTTYQQNQYQGNYSPQPMQPAQNYGQAPPSYNTVPVQNNYNLPQLQGRVVSVPPGTMIQGATTNRTLSSKNLRTGDRINVLLNAPFYYGNAMVLPAGTNISGTVVMAESAGRAGKNGKLMIVFNQAITPQGQHMGLSGKLATDDGSGILKGGTGMDRTKAIVKDTAVGAGSGALFGLLGSAISGGDKGKGAALGTAIGGGLGVAKTVVDKGKEVIIEAGQRLDIILDSELRTGGEQNQVIPTQNLPSMTPNYNY